MPAPLRWALWPRFNLDGSSGGNVIVVRFDVLGMVTVCMAVTLHAIGYKPAVTVSNLEMETKKGPKQFEPCCCAMRSGDHDK